MLVAPGIGGPLQCVHSSFHGHWIHDCALSIYALGLSIHFLVVTIMVSTLGQRHWASLPDCTIKAPSRSALFSFFLSFFLSFRIPKCEPDAFALHAEMVAACGNKSRNYQWIIFIADHEFGVAATTLDKSPVH